LIYDGVTGTFIGLAAQNLM